MMYSYLFYKVTLQKSMNNNVNWKIAYNYSLNIFHKKLGIWNIESNVKGIRNILYFSFPLSYICAISNPEL